MKKTYQTPSTNIVKIDTVQVIAASVNMYGKDATGSAMAPQQRSSDWSDFESGN